MKLLLFMLFSIMTYNATSQNIEKVIVSDNDPDYLYINDNDSNELYYYKIVPKNKPIGCLVIMPSGGEKVEDLLKQITLHHMAVNNDILVIIPSINWGTDDRKVDNLFLDTIFKQIVSIHEVSKDKFIMGGLSNAGMISLNYAQQSKMDNNNTFLVPKGVFALDPPVDFAHFYQYCKREMKRNISKAGYAEASYMIDKYNQQFGGSPENFPEEYIKGSIFSYGAEDGGNTKYLKDIPIRIYTDLDLEYLLNDRHRDLYDWNGTDLVAMINQLKILGNIDANILISQGKGVRLNGMRTSHSWSILDNGDCLVWILSLLKN